MSDHPNLLLARLSRQTLDRVLPTLAISPLTQGEALAETHGPIAKVYFPHSGIISCVVEMVGGGAIETGMIGKDGQFGGGAALDHKMSMNFVVVQVAGEASVVRIETMRELVKDIPEFRAAIVGYEQFFLAQVQQTAACNAAHQVQARTCRWLVRMNYLAGADINLTQECLAQMMGVRRTSVSGVAAELQKAGMISYSRGRVHIENIDLIKRWACECDDSVISHYQALTENLRN